MRNPSVATIVQQSLIRLTDSASVNDYTPQRVSRTLRIVGSASPVAQCLSHWNRGRWNRGRKAPIASIAHMFSHESAVLMVPFTCCNTYWDASLTCYLGTFACLQELGDHAESRWMTDQQRLILVDVSGVLRVLPHTRGYANHNIPRVAMSGEPVFGHLSSQRCILFPCVLCLSPNSSANDF